MAEIFNLNKARKRKVRAEAETTAAANRLKFGRTKSEKLRDAAAVEEAARRLDALKREPPLPPDSEA